MSGGKGESRGKGKGKGEGKGEGKGQSGGRAGGKGSTGEKGKGEAAVVPPRKTRALQKEPRGRPMFLLFVCPVRYATFPSLAVPCLCASTRIAGGGGNIYYIFIQYNENI